MLTVSMELWPYGDQASAKRLVTINIANIGRSNSDQLDSRWCNYIYTVDEPKPLFGNPISVTGVLENYDRQAPGVDIIAAVLRDYDYAGRVHPNGADILTANRMRDKTLEKP